MAQPAIDCDGKVQTSLLRKIHDAYWNGHWNAIASIGATKAMQTWRDTISDGIMKPLTSRKRGPQKWLDADYRLTASATSTPSSSASNQDTQLTNRYMYTVLPQNHIRTLCLYPGEASDIVRVDLEIVSLDDSPEYHALSYTWSPSIPTHVISCGSAGLEIGHNLWLCLKRLRHPTESQTLWIDAVCIDQEDLAERSLQVQLMRRIYQTAAKTIVWLGESNDSTKDGIQLLLRLAYLWSDEPKNEKSVRLMEGHLKPLHLPEVKDKVWEALDGVFWSPWLTRAWIIQEVALSQHITVHIGDLEFSFDDMARAALFATSHGLSRLIGIDPIRARILADYRAEVQCENKTALSDLLALGRRCHATDPRDKIYAFLGLASDGDVLNIQPRYDISVSDTYLMTAKSLLTRDRTLDILSSKESGLNRPKIYEPALPSWVPDWSSPSGCWQLSSYDKWETWCAWLSSVPDQTSMSFCDSDRTLIVSGMIVGIIDRTSLTCVDPVSGDGTIDPVAWVNGPVSKYIGQTFTSGTAELRRLEWLKIAKNSMGETYPVTGEDTIKAYARTIIADAELVDDPATPEIEHDANPDIVVASLHAWSDYSRYWAGYDAAVAMAPARSIVRSLKFEQLHHRAAFGRRLFVSKEPRYIGLCDSLVREGDHIVLLNGGRTPYVLRRNKRKSKPKSNNTPDSEETWAFLREAYVHGLMRYAGDDTILENVASGSLRSFRLL